jgi:hypothetical protein
LSPHTDHIVIYKAVSKHEIICNHYDHVPSCHISTATATTSVEMPDNKVITMNEVPENKAVGLRGASSIIAKFQEYVKETSGEESTCRDALERHVPKDSQCCSGSCLLAFIPLHTHPCLIL